MTTFTFRYNFQIVMCAVPHCLNLESKWKHFTANIYFCVNVSTFTIYVYIMVKFFLNQLNISLIHDVCLIPTHFDKFVNMSNVLFSPEHNLKWK